MPTEPPVDIRDLAAACVRYVYNSVAIEPDFTAETLPLLDHCLSTVARDDDKELLALIAPAAGAYFGEVVARTVGPARWHTAGEDYASYRLEFEHCFLHFNPVGQVLEAIHGRVVDGYNAALSLRAEDARVVKASLERLGDVRSDDYFRLSTRLEVLEQAAATLIATALAKGEAERRYGPRDYATAVAEAEAAEVDQSRPN